MTKSKAKEIACWTVMLVVKPLELIVGILTILGFVFIMCSYHSNSLVKSLRRYFLTDKYEKRLMKRAKSYVRNDR